MKASSCETKIGETYRCWPGVGVLNFAVSFCDAELVRPFSLNLHERSHRSRYDSGQNERERTNSAIGDAAVDGSRIQWEQEKRFQGKTSEEIDSFSLQEYKEYEYPRMERNVLKHGVLQITVSQTYKVNLDL